jgi:hypothetical protein
MAVDLPQLVFTYIARKAAKQEWNLKNKNKNLALEMSQQVSAEDIQSILRTVKPDK